MNNSKVLVTGATGLTGSHTVQLLLDHGRPVRVLAISFIRSVPRSFTRR